MPSAPVRRRQLIPRLALVLAIASAGLALHVRRGAAGPSAKPKHLAYTASYEQAMLEARLRGVPIWFARHKDG